MADRAMQALHLLGFDPIAESQADGHSYGFRLERRCADALAQTHVLLSNRHGPQWILEGDIKACFDKISHNWLLAHVPMDKQVLRQWLKAGFLEKHAWFATTEGTPQGGIVSPALANWTLDGLQRCLAEHFAKTPKQQRMNKVHLVRYADDFLITGTSKELLRDQVQVLVAQFLEQRGLELSHEKTQITHVEQGFDFLGQNVRRYHCGKVFTKPSAQNVKTFLAKIKETIDRSGSLTAGEMIRRLNQQIKGWTMYHRYAASKRTFTYVDYRIFQMVWRWCRRRHPTKSRAWIKTKYFPPDGPRHWIFTGTLLDQKGQGWPIQLMKAAQVRIIR
jgi:RNA-directed DNA polymerase